MWGSWSGNCESNQTSFVTITAGYISYTQNTDTYDNWPVRVAEPLRLKPPPPHRVATAAAMRDRSARVERRPRERARRPVAIERRTWTAAPRRVL